MTNQEEVKFSFRRGVDDRVRLSLTFHIDLQCDGEVVVGTRS